MQSHPCSAREAAHASKAAYGVTLGGSTGVRTQWDVPRVIIIIIKLPH
jgi:hypothetical protein